jgi:hypothetical protein
MPGGYTVRDANEQALAYLYSRDNETEARQAKVLTKDEARRIAINIARLRSCSGRASRTEGAVSQLTAYEVTSALASTPRLPAGREFECRLRRECRRVRRGGRLQYKVAVEAKMFSTAAVHSRRL